VGIGTGKSKKEAEKSAAYNALIKLGLIDPSLA
jgi:dsRNA-specific ribonuclease